MEGKKARREGQWSELPPEILSKIQHHLRFQLDILRFRSVCKTWRCCDRKTIPFPLVIPQPPYLKVADDDDPITFLVTERTLCLVKQGFLSWLVEFDEVLPRRFVPRLTFFKFAFLDFVKRKSIVDMDGFAVAKYHHVVGLSPKPKQGGMEKFGFFDEFKMSFGLNGAVTKTVVLCERVDCNDLVVGALSYEGEVGLLRICESQEWRVVNCSSSSSSSSSSSTSSSSSSSDRFDDIVDFEGELCVVDGKGRAFTVNTTTLELTLIAKEPPCICDVVGLELLARRRRLVNALGKLYLLIPFRHHFFGVVRPGIKVYKLRKQRKEWVEVDSIGDQVFFVGYDFSFGAFPRDVFSSFEVYQNSIIVVSDSFPLYSGYPYVPLFKDLSKFAHAVIYDLPDGDHFKLIPWFMQNGEIMYSIPHCLQDDSDDIRFCKNLYCLGLCKKMFCPSRSNKF